jgi:myo-inositol-1-phosphate synthase
VPRLDLGAPLVLDLVLFADLARRAGLKGAYPEHDLFIQQTKLKNTLRWLMGQEQITHLGMEYYQD